MEKTPLISWQIKFLPLEERVTSFLLISDSGSGYSGPPPGLGKLNRKGCLERKPLLRKRWAEYSLPGMETCPRVPGGKRPATYALALLWEEIGSQRNSVVHQMSAGHTPVFLNSGMGITERVLSMHF
jgi:hypothetical protein